MNAPLPAIILLVISLVMAACASSASLTVQPITLPPPTVTLHPAPTNTSLLPATQPPDLPAPTVSPSGDSCLQSGGRVIESNLKTTLLRQPLEYLVYFPPCYHENNSQRYPVLYLIHGQSYDHHQWERLGAVETANRLVAAGEIPPFLIVMPRDRLWEQPEDDPFGQALVEALIPFIDKTYRTLPFAKYRAVGGLSRGAGWAVHLGLTHWEVFGAIGGHSLPVFHSDASHIRQWLDAIPPGEIPRIYLDIGDKDRPNILRSAVWFEQILTEKSIPHAWFLFTGYHEEAYWKSHLEQYLRWYAEGWEAEK